MKDQISIADILIPPRQRSKVEIDQEFVTSVNRRLINPIILRETSEGIELVAGHRRLEALRKGETTQLVRHTHFRDFSDLDPTDAKIIELEENIRREDLPWKDQVNAIVGLHNLIQPSTVEQTALRVNLHKSYIHKILMVHKNLTSPILTNAEGINHAYSILQVQAERRVAEIVEDVGRKSIFYPTKEPQELENLNDTTSGDSTSVNTFPIDTDGGYVDDDRSNNNTRGSPAPPIAVVIEPTLAILNTDFSLWAPTYTGPKFNLIHCDFPYDIDYTRYAGSTTSGTDYDFKGFWTLTEVLLSNLDRICSYSAHLIFWFSMEFYEKTRTTLESAGLYVHRHPLVWHKTDNAGIVPGRDNQFPRRIYETAFLCSRGKRPLVRIKANTYGAPTATNAIHPSQKPEPMLNFFFEMLVDETTDFFDPTCGSGSSVRSAETCGARTTLGLELNPDYARSAEATTQEARKLRNLKL